MKKMTIGRKIDEKYLAGFLDADGCIHIARKKAIGKGWHSLHLKFVGESKRILIMIWDKYGGSICEINNQHNNGKRYWALDVSGSQAYNLLLEVEPYMIIKKEQARLVIDNWNVLKPHRGGGKIVVTPELIICRDKLYEKMKQMKLNYGPDERTNLDYS